MESKKILALLVDDSTEDRELAMRTLRKHRFIDDILCFKNGLEALDFLWEKSEGESRPRLIFLDLNMPGMGGLEFIEKIKSDARTKEIPVAVLTSTTELPDIKESMRMGIKYYIPKPIESEDVEKIAIELGYFSHDNN